MSAEVTVYRKGTFYVAFPEVEGKCGVFGKTEFHYEAWVTATEGDLDGRGFIVDNADINRYFANTYGLCEPGAEFVSCERMCLRTIRDWQSLWPFAIKVVVRVWGLEDITYVESRWTRPKIGTLRMISARDIELERLVSTRA